MTNLVSILRELVACKDLHDEIEAAMKLPENYWTIPAELQAKRDDYARRKPEAWLAAREALATAEPKAEGPSAMAKVIYGEPNAPQLVTVCKWIVDTAREIPGQANEVAVTREFIGKLRQLIENRPTEPKAEGHHCPSCQCPELDHAGFPVNRPTETPREHPTTDPATAYSPQPGPGTLEEIFGSGRSSGGLGYDK